VRKNIIVLCKTCCLLLQCFHVFISSFQTFVIASQSTLAIIGFAEIAIAVTQCVYCCTTIYGPFRNEDAEMVCLSI